MTLHRKEFVIYLVLYGGLSSVENFREPAVNVVCIVRRDGDRQNLAAIVAHHAFRNLEVNYLLEEVTSPHKPRHGSCQMVVQIGDVLVAWVVFLPEVKHHEDVAILSQTSHRDNYRTQVENGVDRGVVVVCHKMGECIRGKVDIQRMKEVVAVVVEVV